MFLILIRVNTCYFELIQRHLHFIDSCLRASAFQFRFTQHIKLDHFRFERLQATKIVKPATPTETRMTKAILIPFKQKKEQSLKKAGSQTICNLIAPYVRSMNKIATHAKNTVYTTLKRLQRATNESQQQNALLGFIQAKPNNCYNIERIFF